MCCFLGGDEGMDGVMMFRMLHACEHDNDLNLNYCFQLSRGILNWVN